MAKKKKKRYVTSRVRISRIDWEKSARCGWRDMRLCWGPVFLVIHPFSSFPPILLLEVLYIHTYTHMRTHMCVFCLHIYICTVCVLGAGGRQKKASDS